jgi:hypothetical protein
MNNINIEKIESQDKKRFLNIDYLTLMKVYSVKTKNLDSFLLYLHSLATTNNNLIVGVYKKISFTFILNDFVEKTNIKIDKKAMTRILEKLEELEIIKIYDRSKNYLITITNHFENLEILLEYVKSNEAEFQFHIHTSRKNEFYKQYSLFDKKEKANVIKLAYAESQILPEQKAEPADYDPFEETEEDIARRKERENRLQKRNLSFPRR